MAIFRFVIDAGRVENSIEAQVKWFYCPLLFKMEL